jgi:hypothetical protein
VLCQTLMYVGAEPRPASGSLAVGHRLMNVRAAIVIGRAIGTVHAAQRCAHVGDHHRRERLGG